MLDKLRPTLAYVLSLSIALGPLTAHAESDGTRGEEISRQLSDLLDRTAFPNIPRTGPSGVPSSTDLNSQQRQVDALKQSLQSSLLQKILATDDTGGGNDEASEKRVQLALDDLNTPLENYFEAAGKVEALKILLGVPVDEKAWDKNYTLRVPADPIAQNRFLEAVGLHSDYAVYLPAPGYDKEKVVEQTQTNFHFKSTLELNAKNEWELVLRLDPEFAHRTERFKFMMRPELKSALQLAAHFSSETLYTSLGMTRTLLGHDPDTMPAVPAGGTRYLSQRLARETRINAIKREMYAFQKPMIYKTVVDTVEKVTQGGHGSILADENFWSEYARITGRTIKPSTPEELAQLRKDEFLAFARAEAALLNLVQLKDTYRTQEFFLERPKLLSLRSLLIASQKEPLAENAQAALEELLANRAKVWADEMANSTMIVGKVKKLKEIPLRTLLRAKRLDFQKRMEIAAASLKDFENQEINVAYLYASKKNQIEALEPGPLVSALMGQLDNAVSYEQAYNMVRKAINDYVGAFDFKGKKVEPATLAILLKIAPKVTFNPAYVKVPAKYVAALNPPGSKGVIEKVVDSLPDFMRKNAKRWTPEAPGARKKDLLDMLELARLMKFEVYETLNGKKATPDTLLMDSKGLSKTFQPERRAYLAEMERDVLNKSPLLGGQVFATDPTPEYAPTTALWHLLADAKRSAAEKYALVETQLRAIENQVYQNQRTLDPQIAKVDALPERATIEDVGTLNGDLRLIVTHASQIRMGLQSLSSFGSFYDDMRRELSLPGVTARAWGQLTSFANSVGMFGLILAVAPALAGRSRIAQFAATQVTSVASVLFGPQMSRVLPVILASFGLDLAGAAYRGWYDEAIKTETLRKYFDCGSESQCIVLFSDVANQTEVMYMARREFLGQLAILAAIPLGLRAFRFLSARRNMPSGETIRVLRQDLATLGLSETASLSESSIAEAMRRTIAKAQALPDVAARATAENYARQAYWRIENRLQHESLRWMGIFEESRPALRRYNLQNRDWTKEATFNETLGQLDDAYKHGQMLTSDYNDLRATLIGLYQKIQPALKSMEQSPLQQNLFERIWSRANSSSGIGLVTDYQFSRQQFQERMMARMDDYYGRGLRSFQIERAGLKYRFNWSRPDLYPAPSRFDQMLEKIAKEVQDAPELSERRMNELRRMIGGRP